MNQRSKSGVKTSWESAAGWYHGYMGPTGGPLQRDVIFPGALRMLDPEPGRTYLDIACGQGAFARLVAKTARVIGFDASPTLVAQAKRSAPKSCEFLVADATDFANTFEPRMFDGATCLLAIQNIEPVEPVFRAAAGVLKTGAPLVLVLNHPCFRQPRQSGWGWDEKRKLQYRRVDRYLSSYETPILTHPGKDERQKTYSYHRPLQDYVRALTKHGFVIDRLEEWGSPKTSDSGPRAKAENVARAEIPMFLALRARLRTWN